MFRRCCDDLRLDPHPGLVGRNMGCDQGLEGVGVHLFVGDLVTALGLEPPGVLVTQALRGRLAPGWDGFHAEYPCAAPAQGASISASAISVLPQLVSVPVTKMPLISGRSLKTMFC